MLEIEKLEIIQVNHGGLPQECGKYKLTISVESISNALDNTEGRVV